MNIRPLIVTIFTFISVKKDRFDAAEQLKIVPYLVVIDDDEEVKGILTPHDLIKDSAVQLTEMNFYKPMANPEQTIPEIFDTMKNQGLELMPVFENEVFIGIISLEKLTERLLNKAKELQHLYHQMLHDLRNPISNIQGLMNILQEWIQDDEKNELISLSQHSCKHAMEILNGFLEVEIEGSRNKRLVPTDINAFYRSCLNEQKGLCSIKNIELSMEISSDVVIKSIDVLEFKRAIQNLISNAVKFSYPKSKIKVSSKSRDGKVILKIVDCGVGIPEKVKPYIFDSFTIAQRLGTSGEKSTGLGLYFTKQCIESLDGNIFFRSEYGKGTKVYVTI